MSTCTTCNRETVKDWHYGYGLVSLHNDDYSVACDVAVPTTSPMPADMLDAAIRG